MPIRRTTRPLLAAALAAALALPAVALAGGGRHMSPACSADVDRLCPEAEGCARKQCLKDHSDALSATCSGDLAARAERRAAVKAACAADVSRLCGEVESRHEARQCLRSHRDQLSVPCADAIQAMRQAREGAKS
jgi:hypothetical protein